jgi:Skp family chaperone for outer membrane proteins
MIKKLLFLPLSFIFALSSAFAAPSDFLGRRPENGAKLSNLQWISPEIADEIQKNIEAQQDPDQKRAEKLKRKQEKLAKTELVLRVAEERRREAEEWRREVEEERRAAAERKVESKVRYSEMREWDKAERKLAEYHGLSHLYLRMHPQREWRKSLRKFLRC